MKGAGTSDIKIFSSGLQRRLSASNVGALQALNRLRGKRPSRPGWPPQQLQGATPRARAALIRQICNFALARSKCQSDGPSPVSRACAVRSGVDVRVADARYHFAESGHALTWGNGEPGRADSATGLRSAERPPVPVSAAEAGRNTKSSGKALRVVGTAAPRGSRPHLCGGNRYRASAPSCRSTDGRQWRLFAYEPGSPGSRDGPRARASTHPPHSPPTQVTLILSSPV